MKGNDDNYRTVNQALTIYLSDVLQTPLNGLARTELIHRLRERGLLEALLARLEDCFIQSEMGLYGPGVSDAGWSLMSTTEELLFELDQVLGKG